jgi:hypothetical protein
MFAIAHNRTIHVSPDIAEAMAGVESGYQVELHDLPGWTFRVSAPTLDEAQRAAFAVAKREGRARSDAATIVRIAA